jgi:LacI family transcriptional regulator
MGKITVSEVAVRAGVSRATADRVLNRRGGVSVDKERAVLLSARRMGLDRNLTVAPVQQLRMCVLMKPPQNPFYERLASGFRDANLLFHAQAITAYINHIDVLAPDTIHARLRKIAKSYDALVIVAPARDSIIAALRAIAERIPVVTLATGLPLDTAHYYVGPSNYQAGRLAGELMGRMLGPAGGDVLLVAGLREFSGHEERKLGFRDVLAEDFPRCAIAVEVDNFDQSGAAADGVAAALMKNRQIRGIYNISQGNDEITQRLKQRKIGKTFFFICHDLTPTAKALLLSREIDVVIDQDPGLEARRAMEIVLRHYGRLDGSPVDGNTPIRVFFRENVAGEVP